MQVTQSFTQTSSHATLRLCYIVTKMIFLLFLLFLQISCGGAVGASSTAVAAANGTSGITMVTDAIVATDGSIKVGFPVQMEGTTLTESTYQVSSPSGPVSGSISYDPATSIATFTPHAAFLPQTEYTVSVSGALKDNVGHPFNATQTFKFTTSKDALARSSKDPVAASLFGMHIHYADKSSELPTASFRTWRLWDAWVGWPWLEPRKGEWHFEKLDQLVSLAEKKNVEIVLPLGLSPTWASARPTQASPYGVPGAGAEPANIEDWKTYIRTVATRYKGRIHYYELWNEANLWTFYSGTPDTLVVLAKEMNAILKEVDPSNMIISPSCTETAGLSFFEKYVAKGGLAYADIVGYHLYVSPHPPEAMLDLVDKIKTILANYGITDKRIWNTESGWYVQNADNSVAPAAATFTTVISPAEASAYIARAYILNWASGIDRFYWYAWDNKNMGLVESDRKTPKTAAAAYDQVASWLVGANMVSCGKNSQGVWISGIIKASGQKGWIVWKPEGNDSFNIPKEWAVAEELTLAGDLKQIAGTSSIAIGPTPIMLQQSL